MRAKADAFGRARNWILEQLAFLAVVLILAAAFAYLIIEPGRWGRGSGGVALALLLAGALRALLPPARVGLLAVRSRWVDVATYLLLGGLILVIDIRLHA